MGLDVMILVFWMLSFKPAFTLSYFTRIKKLFSSSSHSAIWVVSFEQLGFPDGSVGKESACNMGDLGLIPRLGWSLFRSVILWVGAFQLFFCYEFLRLIPLCSENRCCMISTLLSLLNFVLCSRVWSIQWMFPVGFRRGFILLLLHRVIYRCQLYPIDGWYCWVQLCVYWFSTPLIVPFQ